MKTSIIVQNLKCGGCAHTITTKLSEIENISNITIDVNDSKVFFNYINEADALAVKDKLKTLGYPSIDDANSLTSKAKSFVSCATGKLST
ncbi:heavy-metal-associated domain-containing protein [Lacinutrix sp. C3R15]|uniref:heavy-metal-associated domain-containing protein n=1 Tax=Flavobacteriaceae TaxID=49546 RepID=UPI001C096FCD|nr:MULTISPECIES: heavy-metal-associated domain-containing protein [Flavobacteriaceae]MBU2940460.1 heavy-metal-associated domain-containing protein [Lacinutrix sp. C3R15]MDO6623780.1 heavy-metal-associated domain-containing protein [Oceanihabitans sp. 1_MG-2023]